MNIKVIMSWDIIVGREKDYFEFVIGHFIPRVQEMGMTLSDAWVTIYGEHPQILVGAVVPGLKNAKSIINSDDWYRLNNRLQDYVTNYEFKIARLEGGFQF